MTKLLFLALALGICLGAAGIHYVAPVLFPPVQAMEAATPPRYLDNISGKGYLSNGGLVSVLLSDGRTVAPLQFKSGPEGWEAEIEKGVWVRGGAR